MQATVDLSAQSYIYVSIVRTERVENTVLVKRSESEIEDFESPWEEIVNTSEKRVTVFARCFCEQILRFNQLGSLKCYTFSQSNFDALSAKVTLSCLDMTDCELDNIDNVCNLTNLHTLNVSRCSLARLPVDLWKLKNLRHLGVCSTEVSVIPASYVKFTELLTVRLLFGKFRGPPRAFYNCARAKIYTDQGCFTSNDLSVYKRVVEPDDRSPISVAE